VAVSNKRLRDRIFRKVQNVMSVFQANACMQAAANRRKKQAAAARFIAEARESINYSDDDTPPHNEFNDVLDEICAETGVAETRSDSDLSCTALHPGTA